MQDCFLGLFEVAGRRTYNFYADKIAVSCSGLSCESFAFTNFLDYDCFGSLKFLINIFQQKLVYQMISRHECEQYIQIGCIANVGEFGKREKL